MSTKIYSGIRFHDTDFATLHGKLIAAGVQLRKEAIKICNRRLIAIAVKQADTAALKGTERKRFLTEAMNILMDQIIEANRTQRLNALWMGFEVSVMPFEGRLYGISHGAACHPDRFEAVGFDDFHYQNQTDQPTNVTDQEWSERLRIWTGIFRNSPGWTPVEVSATYRLVTETPEWGLGEPDDLEAILAEFGSDRFDDLAKEGLWDRVLDGEVFEGFDLTGIAGANPPIRRILLTKNAFGNWLLTPVGREVLGEQRRDIASKLKARLTMDDIRC